MCAYKRHTGSSTGVAYKHGIIETHALIIWFIVVDDIFV